jgi:hypothetical protein
MLTTAGAVADRFGLPEDVVASALKIPAVAALASFVMDPNRASAAVHPDTLRSKRPRPKCTLFTLQNQETGTTA